jgi:phospholipid-translocating ATPase
MIDGIYQSIMSFFVPYLMVIGATFVSFNGLDVTDRERLGIYIATPAVITINLYILLNMYRWDWLILLVVAISDIFIFLWTGLYTITTYSGVFYKAAPQVYGELTFWLCIFLTPAICVFPRFVLKTLQKVYRPYDVDIIREQVTLGMFKDGAKRTADQTPGTTEQALKGTSTGSGSGSSDTSRRNKPSHHQQYASVDEDRRPIYPPSVATHNTRNQNGSDGTDYTGHPRHDPTASMDLPAPPLIPAVSGASGSGRQSIERARPSYDRMRASMDRVRPSFEASNDFTTAARLTRIESSHSANRPGHERGASGSSGLAGGAAGRRAFPLIGRARGFSAFSKKSKAEDEA